MTASMNSKGIKPEIRPDSIDGPQWPLGLVERDVPGEHGAGVVVQAVVPHDVAARLLDRGCAGVERGDPDGHVLAFDNVSGLPHWISDTLCRLATGGGFAVRQLYSDQDEVLFDAARPVILNAFSEVERDFVNLDSLPWCL
jgi:hypothetical protein